MTEFVCASIIDYEDGASAVVAVHRGDLESCKKVMDMTPGVTYVPNWRKARSASIEIIPATTFDACMADAIAHQSN